MVSLVEIAYLVGAHGVGGAARLKPFATHSAALETVTRGWLRARDASSGTIAVEIESRQLRDKYVVLKFKGWGNRESTQLFVGATFLVERSDLPPAEPDSYYWADLIGCRVVGEAGAGLGVVESLMTTGAHDVLVVHDDAASSAANRLIPFVGAYVKSVDTVRREIYVEWDASWDTT